MNIPKILILLFGCCAAGVAQGKVLLTLSDALAQEQKSHPSAEWKTENHYLTQTQLDQAKAIAGVKMNGALLVRSLLLGSHGKPLLYAYTDTHVVRSHKETALVLVNSDDSLKSIEILQFDEPLEYLPKSQWFETFNASKLDSELELKRKIPLVTGASLSAKAVLEAARRMLALHQVLNTKSPPGGHP